MASVTDEVQEDDSISHEDTCGIMQQDLREIAGLSVRDFVLTEQRDMVGRSNGLFALRYLCPMQHGGY